MEIPTSPAPDGLAQLHLVIDSDLVDRLTRAAALRGVDLATFTTWLVTRFDLSAELD
jgi:hypothetical protein